MPDKDSSREWTSCGHARSPQDGPSASVKADVVPNMGGVGRGSDLHDVKLRTRGAVEDALADAQQHWDDVEGETVHGTCGESLPDRRRTAGYVHVTLTQLSRQ